MAGRSSLVTLDFLPPVHPAGDDVLAQDRTRLLPMINYPFNMTSDSPASVSDLHHSTSRHHMTPLARAARFVREQRKMTQRAVAEALGVSFVHVSNIERGRAIPSAALIERYREILGVDLHVLSWCLFEDDDQIPSTVRGPRQKLAQAWRRELAAPALKST
jgi:transcriptional regulator with XRE-family HTH domain